MILTFGTTLPFYGIWYTLFLFLDVVLTCSCHVCYADADAGVGPVLLLPL
jgi:hypothetical protein